MEPSHEGPEIASGEVEVRNIAREAGSRSKMAVRATVEGVDPVGVTKVERFTVKIFLSVGSGIGPLTTAPVAFTVFTILSADLSTNA